MIARRWHGAVPTHKAAAYHEYLQQTGLPEYRQTPGNLGVFVLKRSDSGLTHFTLISLWQSMDSIRAFAGADVDRAKYYDEDAQYLVELEPHVTHFTVLDAPGFDA